MKLTRVEVRNYRSFFTGDDNATFELELRDGMNTLVGPNNCGKSNLLRAVALAMNPDYPFDRDADMPAQMMFAYPRVSLHFAVDGVTSPEETLLKYADRYERSANRGRETYAASGESSGSSSTTPAIDTPAVPARSSSSLEAPGTARARSTCGTRHSPSSARPAGSCSSRAARAWRAC